MYNENVQTQNKCAARQTKILPCILYLLKIKYIRWDNSAPFNLWIA